MLIELDVRTLAFMASLGGGLMAVTMTGIYLAGTRDRALQDWAWAGAGFFAGYLAGLLLLTIPERIPSWFSASLANTLIGAGHGFLLLGVQRYLGLPRWTWAVVALVVAMFLVMYFVPELRSSLRMRIITISGGYVVLDAVAGWLLWRHRAPGLTVYRRATAVVLLLFAGFLMLRLGYALVSPALTTSFVQDPFQMVAFLMNTMFCFVLTVALALLMFRGKELEMQRMARRDALTGLYNRFSLSERAAVEAGRADRDQAPLSLVMFDLDDFKELNDHYGHSVGDRVLECVADQIRAGSRESDRAFRIGGEEFLLLLPDTSAGEARRVAERLREAILKAGVPVAGKRVRSTASFGVAQHRIGEESWEETMRRADAGLYEAKRKGRNRVVLYESPDGEIPAPSGQPPDAHGIA